MSAGAPPLRISRRVLQHGWLGLLVRRLWVVRKLRKPKRRSCGCPPHLRKPQPKTSSITPLKTVESSISTTTRGKPPPPQSSSWSSSSSSPTPPPKPLLRDMVEEAEFLHLSEMKAEVKIECSDKEIFRTEEGEDTMVAQLAKIATSGPNFPDMIYFSDEDEPACLTSSRGTVRMLRANPQRDVSVASSSSGRDEVTVPEAWRFLPLPESPPTALVSLPQMEVDPPEEELRPVPAQLNSRELWRDFERVSFKFKDLQRVLHNWEPKLKFMGGAVM